MRDIGMLLSTYRRRAGYKQRELAKILNDRGVKVSFRSISNWEKDVCEPSVTAFLNICQILQVPDVMEAYFGDNSFNPMNRLNEDGRRKVLDYIRLLEGYQDRTYLKEGAADYVTAPAGPGSVVAFHNKSKDIRIFSTSVSAGSGNLLDDDDYDVVNRMEYNVPENADFGVRLSGDSMTPRYQDGQIVWVHQQDTLEEGQIGIFDLNNECFCKKLGYENNRPVLISLNNKKYAPKVVGEEDSFRTFGRVIS